MVEEQKKKSKGAPARAGKKRAARADYRNNRQAPNAVRKMLQQLKSAIRTWDWNDRKVTSHLKVMKKASSQIPGVILNAKRKLHKDTRAELIFVKALTALDQKRQTSLSELYRNTAL
jgi:hypothetical protein